MNPDLLALEWSVPEGAMTPEQIAEYKENVAVAVSYYIANGSHGPFLYDYDTPNEDFSPEVFAADSDDTGTGALYLALEALGQWARYETARGELESAALSPATTEDGIRKEMEGSSNVGELAKKIYQKFNEQKIIAEDPNLDPLAESTEAEFFDDTPGESNTAERDAEIEAERQEEYAAENRARQKAKEEAERIADEVPVVNSRVFNENHFILAQIINLIDLKLNVVDFYETKTYPYYKGAPNACVMVQGDPFSFLSHMTKYPNVAEYFEFTSAQLGSLQPKMRLYKTMTTEDGEVNVPIHFDTAFTSANLQTLLENRARRNTGVGLKSFSIDYVGVDNFSKDKAFEATLKIYAASLEDLFKIREGDDLMSFINSDGTMAASLPYRYIDLALISSLGGTIDERMRAIMELHNITPPMGTMGSEMIKIQLGIADSTNATASNFATVDSVARNSITVAMKAHEYSFKFAEGGTGAVEMEVKYSPYMETRFGGKEFNILSNRDTIKYEIKRDFQKLLKVIEGKEGEESKKEKATRVEREARLAASGASNLIMELGAACKIRYLPLDAKIVQDFLEQGADLDWTKLTKLAPYAQFVGKEGDQEAIKKDIKKEATNTTKKFRGILKNAFSTPLATSARYIYMCDIVDVVLAKMTKATAPGEIQTIIEQLLADDADFKAVHSLFPDYAQTILDNFSKASKDFAKLRVVFGPIEIRHPADKVGNIRIVSIGDLPVPIPLLLEYMVREAGERATTQFDMNAFIRGLINEVTNWLNDDTSFGGELSQGVNIKTTQVVGFDTVFGLDDLTNNLAALDLTYEKLSPDVLKSEIFRNNSGAPPAQGEIERITAHRIFLDDLPVPAINSAPGDLDYINPNGETHYMLVYSEPNCPVTLGWGDVVGDASNGVMHYTLGRDRGIIKDIQLNIYPDNGQMRAMRISQVGDLGRANLQQVYNANIKTYANLNVWPGDIIFVDPSGWSPALVTEDLAFYGSVKAIEDLGLGGYYIVIKSSHVFERGNFETTLECNFVAKGVRSSGPQFEGLPGEGSGITEEKKDSESKCKGGNCDQCNGNSPARLKALMGTYGVQEKIDEYIDRSGLPKNPPPSSAGVNWVD